MIESLLRKLGLGHYEEVFRTHEISEEVLLDLTDTDLRELGLPLGPRKVLLSAIASLKQQALAIDGVVSQPYPEAGPATQPALTERRQLSVMFCDLVGSTALSAKLDPEDLREVFDAVHSSIADVAKVHGGFVAQYLGDGALLYFGYPQANEHDAERAVRAGLALIDVVTKLKTAAGSLEVRIGIATGIVVAGDLKRSGGAPEHAAIGKTPNLAARLQAFAEPNTVLIDFTTRQLTGALFDYVDFGSISAKGFPEAVRAWRVLHSSTIASRFEALRGNKTTLVGRSEELVSIFRAWDSARRGFGQVVQLSGEPGIGKSRILSEVRDMLKSDLLSELRYFCSPHYSDSALYPFVDQIGRAVELSQADRIETKQEKLARYFASTSIPGDKAPFLSRLLSIESCDPEIFNDLTPAGIRERTLASLLWQQEFLARQRPLLILFEDIHWIDPTSLELLGLMIEQVARLPILLLLTSRPDAYRLPGDLPHTSHLTLERLSQKESTDLVAQLAGRGALPPELIEKIVGRADGIPLFVEELANAVLDVRSSAAGGNDAPAGLAADSRSVPISLHSSLIARLDRLGPHAKTLAQAGAAIGREFSRSIIAAVSGLDSLALIGGLAQLIESQVIFQRGSPSDVIYVFKHALIQDVAYNTLLKAPRQALHARIAHALQVQTPLLAEAQPELLAHHLTEARQVRAAIDQWRRAGDVSLSKFATAEAANHFRAALALLNEQANEGSRAILEEADLQLRLGAALRAATGIAAPEARAAFQAAEQLFIVGGDVKRRFDALYGLMLSHLNRGEHEETTALARKMEDLARTAKDGTAILRALEIRGLAQFDLGNFEEALSVLKAAITASQAESEESLPQAEPLELDPNVLIYLGLTLYILGFPIEARTRLQEGLIAAAASTPVVATHAVYNACYFTQIEGDWLSTRERAEATLRSASERGIPRVLPFGRIFFGWAIGEAGDPEQGLAEIGDFSGIASDWVKIEIPYILAVIAQVYLRAGQQAKALELFEEAIALGEQTGERWFEAELHRLHGECYLRLREPESVSKAEACFHRALEVARAQNALLWELRAALSLAMAWLDCGRDADAKVLLRSLCDRFDGDAPIPHLAQAREVLDRVSESCDADM